MNGWQKFGTWLIGVVIVIALLGTTIELWSGDGVARFLAGCVTGLLAIMTCIIFDGVINRELEQKD